MSEPKVRTDLRHHNRGPGGRKWLDLKASVMTLALLANVAAVVWKGGEISGKFTSLMDQVQQLNLQLGMMLRDQNLSERALAAQQERIIQQGERLSNHENRIIKLEDRTR